MKLRTIAGSVGAFSVFALLGALIMPGSTFALWSDQAAWKQPVSIQPNSISARTDSSDRALLAPVSGGVPQELSMSKNPDGTWAKSSAAVASGGTASYLDYSYVGSQFYWDAEESASRIADQIEEDSSREWYGVAAFAQLETESHGALSWGVLTQWEPRQDTGRDSLWDESWVTVFKVDQPSQCVIDDSLASSMMDSPESAYTDAFYEGPRFAPGMAQGSTSGAAYICVAQVYVPLSHTDTAIAAGPNGELAEDSWSAVLYHTQPELAQQPRLGLFLTPIDPLNGPVMV